MASSYQHENSSASGIVLAHTVTGSPTTGTLRPEMANEGTVRQVQPVFTNYRPPKRRAHDKGGVLCSEEGCAAYPQSGKNYCAGHARLRGESKTCKNDGCMAPPKKGTDHCRWHTTAAVTDEPE